MLFKLEHNRNYAYLFFVIIGLTLFSWLTIGEKLSGIMFFLSFYYLGILQLQSGLVLNRSWTAKYKKEEHPFMFWIAIILSFAMGTLGLIAVLSSFF